MSKLTPMALAVTFAFSLPGTVHANSPKELAEIKAQIQEMKAAYEQRIASLERKLAQAEATANRAETQANSAVTKTQQVATQRPVASQARSNSFNPEVSLILQGQYKQAKDVFIPVVPVITAKIEAMAGGAASELSRGGMMTKIEAAKIATTGGAAMLIANGTREHPLKAVIDGARCTWFLSPSTPVRASAGSRARWSRAARSRSTMARSKPCAPARACCPPVCARSKGPSRAAIASPCVGWMAARSRRADRL